MTKRRFVGISDLRRENLIRLIAEHGQKSLAKKIERSDTLLNSYKSHTVKKNIGEKFARHIESALNLPFGWMDSDHNQGEIVLSPEQQELVSLVNQLSSEDAIKAVRIIKILTVKESLGNQDE
jgi:phosphopantetheine adenylyltransferase